MDITPQGLLKSWVPQLPALLRTALLASIGRSPNAEHQEWITELVVASAKPVLGTPAALLKSQEYFRWDLPVLGRMWIAKYTVPSPNGRVNAVQTETGADRIDDTHRAGIFVEEAVALAIKDLAAHDGEGCCPIPAFEPSGVETEWTSYRRNAWPWSRPPPSMSPGELYDCAIKDLPESEDSPVILYAHGGAFCLMDPANHRYTTSLLAQLTDTRVLSVRYRLSPQNIFPAALMDMFLVYLSLIAPPPGAFHRPVPASRIVLAGDSSGGNLVTALRLLLVSLLNNGRDRIQSPWPSPSLGTKGFITIPNPPCASLSLTSPWLDITRSLPSQQLNARYDFIAPAPPLDPKLQSTSPLFPTDTIWPSDPQRAETYCEARMCAHPLVSPIAARKDTLKFFEGGFYVNTGWEGMSDECEVLARRVWEAKNGMHLNIAKNRTKLLSEHYQERGGKDSGYASSSSSAGEGGHDSTCTHNDLEAASAETRKQKDMDIKVDTGVSCSPLQSNTKTDLIMFDGYTAQPHTFSFLPFSRAGWKATHRRSDHIRKSVQLMSRLSAAVPVHTSSDIQNSTSRAIWTNSKTMEETRIAFSELGMCTGQNSCCGYNREEPLTDEIVQRLVGQGRDFRVQLERRLRNVTTEKPQPMEEKERNASLRATGKSTTRVFTLATQLLVRTEAAIDCLMWSLFLLGRDWVFLLFNWTLWQAMQFGLSF